MGLSEGILQALEDLNFHTPTEIQQQAIPGLITHESDFIGLAQTGTGKTAAFGIPLLQLLDPFQNHTQALILSPTRELTQQICKQLDELSVHLPKLKVVSVYGGANINTQIKQLKRGAQIIVATPGRLMDLMKRGNISLEKLDFLVLDEADEMMNMGFKDDVDFILSHTPQERNIWMFSATMAKEIKKIVDKYMYKPLEVKVQRKNIVNTNIEHQFLAVKAKDKLEVLKRYVALDTDLYGVVFCRTKRETQQVAENLNQINYVAEALHGDMSQAQRDVAMDRFRNKKCNLLVATDVAARGIDVEGITHVFHHSLPDDAEFYTHRSGRTARAGKKGISLAFISGKDVSKKNKMERELKISFAEAQIPDVKDIKNARITQWANELLELEINEKETLPDEIAAAFEDMSKEELLLKLYQKEIKRLDKKIKQVSLEKDTLKSDKREKGANGVEKGMDRFYINLGKKDGFNKGKLLGFVCDNTGLSSKDIGRIDMSNTHTLMDVKQDFGPMMDLLDGTSYQKRTIKTRLDNPSGKTFKGKGRRNTKNNRRKKFKQKR